MLKEKMIADLQVKIQEYCDKNPVKIDFDRSDNLSKNQIISILEEGSDNFCNELYENNLDYIFQQEDFFKEEIIFDHFKSKIAEILLSDHSESEIDDKLIKEFINELEIYPVVNLNYDQLLNTEILASLIFYSNYDCTNSMDTMSEKGYLSEIFKVVRKGIKKDDYLSEHANVYGACLLELPFTISLNDFLELKEKIKTCKSIEIPKNTQFGFFGEFLGSGSQFENKTFKKMTIPVCYGNAKYDRIGIKADAQRSYNYDSVYGGFQTDCFNFKLK
jgi:hypothetical protein